MNSFRKWLYKPKKTDSSLLAQFYFADEDLNQVAAELDSFDGRKDPERCTMLVNQLRVCQDRVLTVIQKIMDDAIPSQRANRDFRVKFPDDVLQESLAGQLWFGAECLAAGSSILNREVESASMRPLARALTKNLDSLRSVLREQCLRTLTEYTDRIQEALVIFDKLFAEFELSYVSAMVPVKTMKEYDMLQEVTVLFSETVQRALELELVSQDMIDDYDPALMFTIPRLAIVCGLLIYPEGPLNPDMEPTNISEMYRPFQTLLFKIRELLYTLSNNELVLLEKSLCSSEEPDMTTQASRLGKEDGYMQVDQGFHESGEGIVPAGDLGSSLLLGSDSPRTPVNTDPGLLDLEDVSPSSTIEEGSFSFSQPHLERASSEEEVIMNLNKSESQDSGLHSENVSTSDTVTVDCLPCISQEVEGTTETMPSGSSSRTGREATLPVLSKSEIIDPEIVRDENSCDYSSVNVDVMETSGSNSNLADISERNADESESNLDTMSCDRDDCEAGYDAHQMCCSILAELVDSVVHHSQGATSQGDNTNCCDKVSDCDSNCDSREPAGSGDNEVTEGHTTEPLSRQFSWQYNVQFALPHISVSEQEIDAERASSGSISSSSTISDNNQPCDSVTEFVIETLAAMGSDTMLATAASTHCDNPQPHSSDSKNQVSSDKTVSKPVANHQRTSASKCHTSRNTNQPRSAQRSRSNVPSDMVDYLDCSVAHGSNSEPPSRSSDSQHVQKGRGKQENYESLEHIHCKTGSQSKSGEHKTDGKAVQTVKNPDTCSLSSSSCHSNASCTSSCSCDKDCCCTESETSSCISEANDDEEIALAIQAAEMASRSEARSRFRSSSDLIHRLFVCIAGVADQLQTNYASDLRHILKCVFELNSTNVPELDFDVEMAEPAEVMNSQPDEASSVEPGERVSSSTPRSAHQARHPHTSTRTILDEPPSWVPDDEAERCTACKSPFTFVRRRHHCRNCGKIFCGKCSSTTMPLPQYGHQKPVRVCHRCFLFQVSHFTISD